MGNCVFAFPDYSQPSNTYSPVFSNGGWLPSLPLSNLQNKKLFPPARSSNASVANTKFILDLMIPRPVKVLAMVNHNSTDDGKICIKLWKGDPDTSELVYNTGDLNIWPPFYDFGNRDWLDPEFWNLKLSPEDKAGYRPNFIHIMSETKLIRSITVQIIDPDNSDGYFQMSRFMVCRGWQPNTNMSYGSNITWSTDTQSRKTPSSKTFFDVRPAYRKAIINLDTLTDTEGRGMAFEMDRQLGISGQLLFVWDPDDIRLASLQRSFLATIETLNPLEYPSFGINTKSYELVEVL